MNKSILAASLTTALSLTQSLAFADEEQMVVTASRVAELSSLAASVTIISAENIANSAVRTLPELLSEHVGVNTRGFSSHANRSSVDIRGFGSTASQNTLILLDGRRLNDIDLSSVNFAAIPFENIERIEIIRGSGGVLYGDGASGGVINIITKDPRETKNYTQLGLTSGSFDHRELNLTSSYTNDLFAVTANINGQESDGYRDNNNFDQNSAQMDLRVPLAGGEGYAKLGAFEQDMRLPGARRVKPATQTNELVSDRNGTGTPNDWADESTEFATLGYSMDLNDNDSLVVDAGYRRKRQRSQFDYGFGYGAYTETVLETLSLTPRLMLDRELAGYSSEWLLGFDVYLYDYDSARSNFKSNVGQPIHQLDVTQESFALYGQTTVALTDNTWITAGARVQRVRQQASDGFDATAAGSSMFDSQAADMTRSDTEESYELGIKHLFAEHWSVYARVDRSARFGTVDELFELNDSYAQVFSELKPQLSRGVEAGINFDNAWLSSSLSVFHQQLSDEIRFNPTTFQNVNLDDTEHEGLELSATARLHNRVTLTAAYTYLNATFTEGLYAGNSIPLVPEHTYNASLLTRLPFGFKVAVNWNYVSGSYFANDLTNTFGLKIPSYQTVDLKLSKEMGPLGLAIQVNNVLDEEYFNYAVNSTSTAGTYNAYPLAERNVYVSASYRFE